MARIEASRISSEASTAGIIRVPLPDSIVKGSAAIGPMLFFAFEVISCFIDHNLIDNRQCRNTNSAALYLSAYLGFLTAISLAYKTVPMSVQRVMAWELSSIATLELKWWQ